MRKTLTDKGVMALKPRADRYAFPDPQLVGLYVRVTPRGAKSFATVARDPTTGKQVWSLIGATDVMKIAEAREKAREVLKRVRAGLPAFEALPVKPDTFQDIAQQWLKRNIEGKRRSQKQITRLLTVHVYPRWGERPFLGIRRSDVAALLDHVEDNHSARQADCVLAVVRSIMNWHATRHDDYLPPIVKGMRRQNPKDHVRKRILDDSEIRKVWHAAEAGGTFGAIVRLLLLTGQRREKVVSMRWKDVSVDGTWTIPREVREKGNAGELLLPPVALDIIRDQPHMGDNVYVFAAAHGDGHFSGYSKSKRAFDAKLTGVPGWTLHDLRRSARSLMSRAGVLSEIAERVLGHDTEGVEGVYDQHEYGDEKAEALRKLVALIAGIVTPRKNVVPLRR